MEVSFAWFWLIKLSFLSTFTFVLFKNIRYKFRNKVYVFAGVVLLLTYVFTPVRIGLETRSIQQSQNQQIEQAKVLPPKEESSTFTSNVSKDITIKKEDLK